MNNQILWPIKIIYEQKILNESFSWFFHEKKLAFEFNKLRNMPTRWLSILESIAGSKISLVPAAIYVLVRANKKLLR